MFRTVTMHSKFRNLLSVYSDIGAAFFPYFVWVVCHSSPVCDSYNLACRNLPSCTAMIANTTESTIVRTPPPGDRHTSTQWADFTSRSTSVYVVHLIECVRFTTEIAIPAGLITLTVLGWRTSSLFMTLMIQRNCSLFNEALLLSVEFSIWSACHVCQSMQVRPSKLDL